MRRAVDPDWGAKVVDAALDAILSIDAEGLLIDFNPAAEQMFGYTRDEVVGQALADLIIPSDFRPAHLAGLMRLAAGETPRILDTRVELRACDREGREFPVELTVTQTGRDPVIYTGFIRDLSRLDDAERRYEAREAVRRTLREWQSYDEGVVDLLARIGRALGYPIGTLWTFDERRQLIVCRAFWNEPDADAEDIELFMRKTAVFSIGEGVPGRVWAGEDPVSGDPQDLLIKEQGRLLAAAAGMQWGIAFSARTDSGPVAVLSYFAPAPRRASEMLFETLRDIGREIGPFLERRGAHLGAEALSPRELEVLRLAAEGNTGPQIAERLVISPETVKTHFGNIFEKLGVSDRAAAVALAFRIGLLT